MRLFLAVFRKEALHFIRYRAEIVGEVVGVYFLFLALVGGWRWYVGGRFPVSLAVLFAVWYWAAYGLWAVPWWVWLEGERGTLEQCGMTRYGLVNVALAHGVADAVLGVFVCAPLYFAAVATSGRWEGLSGGAVTGVLVYGPAAVVGAVGAGMVLGAVMLWARRLWAIVSVVEMAFPLLMAAPPEKLTYLGLLPVALPAYHIKACIKGGGVDLVGLILCWGVAVLWLWVGIAVLKFADRVVRRRGILGHF